MVQGEGEADSETVSDGEVEGVCGLTTTGAASSVVRLGFPSRRSIRAVRLVLDTRKVAGWNELDAVGLVP